MCKCQHAVCSWWSSRAQKCGYSTDVGYSQCKLCGIHLCISYAPYAQYLLHHQALYAAMHIRCILAIYT